MLKTKQQVMRPCSKILSVISSSSSPLAVSLSSLYHIITPSHFTHIHYLITYTHSLTSHTPLSFFSHHTHMNEHTHPYSPARTRFQSLFHTRPTVSISVVCLLSV